MCIRDRLEGLWEKYPKAIGQQNVTAMAMALNKTLNATANLTSSSCYGTVEPYWANMFRYSVLILQKDLIFRSVGRVGRVGR